jgi:hypothetical protein
VREDLRDAVPVEEVSDGIEAGRRPCSITVWLDPLNLMVSEPGDLLPLVGNLHAVMWRRHRIARRSPQEISELNASNSYEVRSLDEEPCEVSGTKADPSAMCGAREAARFPSSQLLFGMGTVSRIRWIVRQSDVTIVSGSERLWTDGRAKPAERSR